MRCRETVLAEFLDWVFERHLLFLRRRADPEQKQKWCVAGSSMVWPAVLVQNADLLLQGREFKIECDEELQRVQGARFGLAVPVGHAST